MVKVINVGKCIVENCNREQHVRHLCSIHYLRFNRHGTTDILKCNSDILFERGLGYCPSCKRDKSLKEFSTDNQTHTGKARYCKKCQKNKASLRYRTHPERHRNTQLKCDFGITLDQYKEIFNKQEGKCTICESKLSKSGKIKATLDHDHITGKVRGILCQSCNFGLGHFKDDPILLEKARNYLVERR